MDKALEKLEEMGLIEDSDGAKLINLEKWKLGKAVVRKRGKFEFFQSSKDVVDE